MVMMVNTGIRSLICLSDVLDQHTVGVNLETLPKFCSNDAVMGYALMTVIVISMGSVRLI